MFLHERKACSFQQLPSKAFHLQSFLSVLTRMFYSNSCQVKALYVRSFRSAPKTRQANHVASPANASGATMCASATTLPIGEPRAPTVYSIHIFLSYMYLHIIRIYVASNYTLPYNEKPLCGNYPSFQKARAIC